MIRFYNLGTLELRAADGSEVRSVVTQSKRVALLTYLVVASPRGFHRRDTLLGLLWPELDAEHARDALNQTVYRLRQSLGPRSIANRGKEELGVDAASIWCDAVAFEQALDAGSVRQALELYRGDLLPGFFLSGAPEWQQWLENERARLRTRAAAASWALAEQAAAETNPADAAAWGCRAVALAPADEVQLRRLIGLLDRLGDRAGALRVYEEAAERLARDYEIELSPETRALMENVRAREEPVGASPDRRAPGGPPASETAPDHQYTVGEEASYSSLRRVRKKRRLMVFGMPLLITTILVAVPLLWPRVRANNASQGSGGDAALPIASRVAVLPLVDSSRHPQNAYFADGLTEELIAGLSGAPDLRVIAPTSVMRYRNTDKSVAVIGRELGVGALLAGSVRKEGERVRISVRLVEAATAEHLWVKDYDADIVRLPTVQRDIAQQVVSALRLPARARERRRLSAAGTQNPDAYTEYLEGRYFLGKLDADAFRAARDRFEQSLDLDPTFARAWSGLSEAYNHLTSLMVLPASEAYPRARAAAERALELDPELGEAHAALAIALTMYYWDTDAAERHFRRALELDPSSARSHRMYATHLRDLGRFEEALTEVRTAKELDPLSAFSYIEEGIILYVSSRYDEALAKFEQLLRVAPNQTHTYVFIALVHAANRQYAEALSALGAVSPQDKRPDVQAIRGYIYARMGRRDTARQFLARLEQLSQENLASPFHKAVIHVGLGEHEWAVDLLEEAAREPTWQMRLLKVHPLFEPLRSQPRFQALLVKVGLAQ